MSLIGVHPSVSSRAMYVLFSEMLKDFLVVFGTPDITDELMQRANDLNIRREKEGENKERDAVSGYQRIRGSQMKAHETEQYDTNDSCLPSNLRDGPDISELAVNHIRMETLQKTSHFFISRTAYALVSSVEMHPPCALILFHLMELFKDDHTGNLHNGGKKERVRIPITPKIRLKTAHVIGDVMSNIGTTNARMCFPGVASFVSRQLLGREEQDESNKTASSSPHLSSNSSSIFAKARLRQVMRSATNYVLSVNETHRKYHRTVLVESEGRLSYSENNISISKYARCLYDDFIITSTSISFYDYSDLNLILTLSVQVFCRSLLVCCGNSSSAANIEESEVYEGNHTSINDDNSLSSASWIEAVLPKMEDHFKIILSEEVIFLSQHVAARDNVSQFDQLKYLGNNEELSNFGLKSVRYSFSSYRDTMRCLSLQLGRLIFGSMKMGDNDESGQLSSFEEHVAHMVVLCQYEALYEGLGYIGCDGKLSNEHIHKSTNVVLPPFKYYSILGKKAAAAIVRWLRHTRIPKLTSFTPFVETVTSYIGGPQHASLVTSPALGPVLPVVTAFLAPSIVFYRLYWEFAADRGGVSFGIFSSCDPEEPKTSIAGASFCLESHSEDFIEDFTERICRYLTLSHTRDKNDTNFSIFADTSDTLLLYGDPGCDPCQSESAIETAYPSMDIDSPEERHLIIELSEKLTSTTNDNTYSANTRDETYDTDLILAALDTLGSHRLLDGFHLWAAHTPVAASEPDEGKLSSSFDVIGNSTFALKEVVHPILEEVLEDWDSYNIHKGCIRLLCAIFVREHHGYFPKCLGAAIALQERAHRTWMKEERKRKLEEGKKKDSSKDIKRQATYSSVITTVWTKMLPASTSCVLPHTQSHLEALLLGPLIFKYPQHLWKVEEDWGVCHRRQRIHRGDVTSEVIVQALARVSRDILIESVVASRELISTPEKSSAAVIERNQFNKRAGKRLLVLLLFPLIEKITLSLQEELSAKQSATATSGRVVLQIRDAAKYCLSQFISPLALLVNAPVQVNISQIHWTLSNNINNNKCQRYSSTLSESVENTLQLLNDEINEDDMNQTETVKNGDLVTHHSADAFAENALYYRNTTNLSYQQKARTSFILDQQELIMDECARLLGSTSMSSNTYHHNDKKCMAFAVLSASCKQLSEALFPSSGPSTTSESAPLTKEVVQSMVFITRVLQLVNDHLAALPSINIPASMGNSQTTSWVEVCLSAGTESLKLSAALTKLTKKFLRTARAAEKKIAAEHEKLKMEYVKATTRDKKSGIDDLIPSSPGDGDDTEKGKLSLLLRSFDKDKHSDPNIDNSNKLLGSSEGEFSLPCADNNGTNEQVSSENEDSDEDENGDPNSDEAKVTLKGCPEGCHMQLIAMRLFKTLCNHLSFLSGRRGGGMCDTNIIDRAAGAPVAGAGAGISLVYNIASCMKAVLYMFSRVGLVTTDAGKDSLPALSSRTPLISQKHWNFLHQMYNAVMTALIMPTSLSLDILLKEGKALSVEVEKRKLAKEKTAKMIAAIHESREAKNKKENESDQVNEINSGVDLDNVDTWFSDFYAGTNNNNNSNIRNIISHCQEISQQKDVSDTHNISREITSVNKHVRWPLWIRTFPVDAHHKEVIQLMMELCSHSVQFLLPRTLSEVVPLLLRVWYRRLYLCGMGVHTTREGAVGRAVVLFLRMVYQQMLRCESCGDSDGCNCGNISKRKELLDLLREVRVLQSHIEVIVGTDGA